ncbi:UTP--glucose-1-phosphate uridylyltransferase [Chitinivibrio alkaliphilus]|uniref:UTP--glucose-1-phosphate uridylyltransferase n=1 Tax=Chitinivibrio alkaliphilus ACht1 TaxID=1313304 RepID=U7DAH4_9BACT|nr:UTP--glucose-1-phosphate uridylyltransferase [Chitinivibrio alkaliphilus]ERP39032.1 UTP--glucose-1-phosphate uridylyltransferase [Chitinivibrio alkaliphilus ACht1]
MTESFGCTEKMQAAGIDQRIIDLFHQQLEKLHRGDRGYILEEDLTPVMSGEIPRSEDLGSYLSVGQEALSRCAVIKLNGGLGTSMGLQGPKSFLPVKGEKRFIDIVIAQIEMLRQQYGQEIPLIFMNSAVTDAETRALVKEHAALREQAVSPTFVHHSHPKVRVDTLSAVDTDTPDLEWNPAGHGDVYASLYVSGLLDALLDRGIDLAFISNIDNLGATLDPSILGYVEHQRIPFLMEVCHRREMDKKGGHIARSTHGYCLRERAQTREEDLAAFEDINRYSYFNSNSLWVNLRQLREYISSHGLPLLPLIANEKHLDPRDESTPKVYQIETAMGSALSLFSDSVVLEIPQKRFLPVKKNSDLLLLRSDRYHVDTEDRYCEEPGVTSHITVELDERYYKKYDDFCARVRRIPSLQKCRRFSVTGDVVFKENVECIGEVAFTNSTSEPLIIENRVIKTRQYKNKEGLPSLFSPYQQGWTG